jgi:CRISPR system Cascade subunit CasA
MQFNLIDEKWIPIKRRDGTEENIAPWEVTDGFIENPVVSLNAPRPDFNGALIQFLIGLVQTTAAPANRIEWKLKLNTPPETGELQIRCATVRHAFELAGDGPRFMQDFDEIVSQPGTIDGLLIDNPGENTLKNNADHFVKRGGVASMCPSCCAIALFTMQTNAPLGGQGYRTSLRGGGPLTTLVVGDERFDALWQTIWLNVLENGRFLSLCNGAKNLSSDKFPWLAETQLYLTAMDIHPAQLFWAMPRRIRFDLHNLASGVCDVCSAKSDHLISSYREKNRGTEYKAPIKHLLSPYDGRKGKSVLGQPGGVNYRHWLGFIVPNSEIGKEPAIVVHEYNDRQQSGWQFRLWAFGYDMYNMKARCWYDAKMPLLLIEPSLREDYEHWVASMIKAAVVIAGNVRSAVRKAWFRHPGDIKGDTSFLDDSFWQNTEPAFYEALQGLKAALESGGEVSANRKLWLDSLCRQALILFDVYAWRGPIEDAEPKRVVIARSKLEKFNRSKKIKDLLELP